jgi:hypothetical protein
VDLTGQRAVAEVFQMVFRESDVADPANGPNGQSCANGKPEDLGDPFDLNFTCNCLDAAPSASPELVYSGANCQNISTRQISVDLMDLLVTKEEQNNRIYAAHLQSYGTYCSKLLGFLPPPVPAEWCWVESCKSELINPVCVEYEKTPQYGWCSEAKQFRVLDTTRAGFMFANRNYDAPTMASVRWLDQAYLSLVAEASVKDTSWIYSCSEHGAMQSYPDAPLEACYDYDPRGRGWYKSAIGSPRDTVIVLDVSGSMDGRKFGLAKAALLESLSYLSYNDFVAIVTFNEEATQLCGALTAGCSSWQQVSGCDGGGMVAKELGCKDEIKPTQAGFCSCHDGSKLQFDCGHQPFTCHEKCGSDFNVNIPCGELVRASSLNRNAIVELIEDLVPQGASDLSAGLELGLDLFPNGIVSDSAYSKATTSGCSRALLMFVDGDTDSIAFDGIEKQAKALADPVIPFLYPIGDPNHNEDGTCLNYIILFIFGFVFGFR